LFVDICAIGNKTHIIFKGGSEATYLVKILLKMGRQQVYRGGREECGGKSYRGRKTKGDISPLLIQVVFSFSFPAATVCLLLFLT
jgi:hypothetical protein